jgi:very-short-patch-repair endonuclease
MKYPYWRKRFHQIRDRWHPEPSEMYFIKLMGRWWLYRHGFKHQVMISGYIADFVCANNKLIIEIEGKKKYYSGDIVKDQQYREYQQIRHAALITRGWNIRYVWYEDIRDNPKQTKAGVKRWERNNYSLLERILHFWQ